MCRIDFSSLSPLRNNNRQEEIKQLTAKGIIPHEHELEKYPEKSLQGRTFLIGRVAALIHDVLPGPFIRPRP